MSLHEEPTTMKDSCLKSISESPYKYLGGSEIALTKDDKNANPGIPFNIDQNKLDTLVDLFPYIPPKELAVRLKSCDDIQIIVDSLFKESGDSLEPSQRSDPKDESNPLVQIFPDYSKTILDMLLEEVAGNLEIASSYIVSGYVLKKPEKQYTTKKAYIWSSTAPEAIKNRSAKSSEPLPQHVSSWDEINNSAGILHNLIDVPKEIAKAQLHKFSGNIGNALIHIIDSNLKEVQKDNSPSIITDGIVRGGRVLGPSSHRMIIPSEKKPPLSKRQYSQSEIKDAIDQFEDIYADNSDLRPIKKEFLIKALKYLDGDISRTIDVASFMIQNNIFIRVSKVNQAQNICSKNSAKEISLFKSTPFKIKNSNKAVTDENQSFNYRALNTSEQQLTSNIIKAAQSTSKIDLHNLSVAAGKYATTYCLDKWWNSELEIREREGELSKYGYSAMFMAPFTVITGRGIHSKDGKSRIKIAVNKILDMNNYLYDEYPGQFVINGRKK